ncbi:MAG: CFI-box-CTERM domain-containing protein [Haloferacaceae archaeon]
MGEEGRDSNGDARTDSWPADDSTADDSAATRDASGGGEDDSGHDSGATTDDESDDEPVEIGDGRQKHVAVVTAAGEEISHGDVYLRHSEAAFVVSPESEFPASETTRYRKENLDRVEVTQHHAGCFITTATAGDGPTLDALRGFRDDVLTASPPGRALLRTYDAVSPPIAATLARHPDARSTRLVRRLVERCGTIARRREGSSPAARAFRSLSLTALYVVGVCLATAAHLWLATRGERNGHTSGRRG